MSTVFTPILQRILDRIPGTVGVIFADWEGEAVDQVSSCERHDALVLAAHYGVILKNVQGALKLFHFGDVLELTVSHDRMDIIIRPVCDGYYLVLACEPGVHLASALRETQAAAHALKAEMY
ncbi:MAG: roadblock/LC7 domain-containing protein [Deltaproteobacteria bacterium]|nr:roadblock/LC7 domain-containing protein [Deltaproteobacteria bacterium]